MFKIYVRKWSFTWVSNILRVDGLAFYWCLWLLHLLFFSCKQKERFLESNIRKKKKKSRWERLALIHAGSHFPTAINLSLGLMFVANWGLFLVKVWISYSTLALC